MPKIFLPIDTHIIEYSKLRHLIEQVPDVLRIAKEEKNCPYLPIYPKSYRKDWQYDDEPYNYIYDFLAAFTEFNFSKELQQALNRSRLQVSSENSEDNLTDEDILEIIADMKPDGLEANYLYVDRNNNKINEMKKWNKFAKENNLFVTVGSDFHNKDGLRPEIGFVNIDFILDDDAVNEIINNLMYVL